MGASDNKQPPSSTKSDKLTSRKSQKSLSSIKRSSSPSAASNTSNNSNNNNNNNNNNNTNHNLQQTQVQRPTRDSSNTKRSQTTAANKQQPQHKAALSPSNKQTITQSAAKLSPKNLSPISNISDLNKSKSKQQSSSSSRGSLTTFCGSRMAHSIQSIKARQIYDSRGNPTVEVDLINGEGHLFRAAVPSGASTGIHEALELRDKDKANWHGKGVLKAVKHVNETIGPAVIAKQLDVVDQAKIDNFMIELDGTDNKNKFGANAILGISLAVCKAGAHAKGVPLYQHIANLANVKELILPVPAFNVINGGSHAGNSLAMQEFMILPTGASSFSEAMKMGSEVYHHLKNVIKEQFGQEATCVGDEGGFAPNIQNNKQGLELIKKAIDRAGYVGKIEIGMDVAASEFYKEGKYDLLWKTKQSNPAEYLTGEKLGDVYRSYVSEFPIVSIEDPFDQDDWDSWSKLTSSVDIQIVGDDLTVTNPKRILAAVEKKSCNCLLLKVNQIGTVTESIAAHNLAKLSGWGTMISHRSGETEDTFIADLTVGLSTGQIKTGAPSRSERLAKYNQILRIEEELGSKAKFAGKNFRHPLKE